MVLYGSVIRAGLGNFVASEDEILAEFLSRSASWEAISVGDGEV